MKPWKGVAATAILALCAVSGIRADVSSLTLGITTNCPYGLAA